MPDHNANIKPVGEDPFYIGWMPQAPHKYAQQIKKAIAALFVLVVIAGTLLALSQKKFSTSSFEFGQLTEIRGVYQQHPVPAIKVITRKDNYGNNEVLTIPLVGYGKFGAEGAIMAIEKEKKIVLDNKEVTMEGTLLYSDGKTLLQVDEHDKPLTQVSSTKPSQAYKANIKDLGVVKLRGEVLDPKCYFGVMKPGHGKPHRDCAIRCLLGGISPVFHVRNQAGGSSYYLILGEHGEKINGQLQDYVADPVELEANAKQYDDWTVLYIKPQTIKRISTFSWIKNTEDEFASCGESMH